MFKIGSLEIKNNVALAPMAGISNPSYMKIVESMGVSLAVTELISSEAIVRNNKKTLDMLNGIEHLNLNVGVQIFGSNPNTLARAAKIITDRYKNVFIDINMGCPVPKVAVRANSGSALLKDKDLVYQIVSKVVSSVDVPVTVKIRSGWDNNSINAKEIAQIIESAGASAITIHPRTRAQGYTGMSDWSIIKQVKESVNIPVIGNGDIKTIYDAKRMIDETGCDCVMIGRAALGNPWIFKECIEYLNNNKVIDNPNMQDRIDMIKQHLDYLIQDKCEKLAMLEIRSHAIWYLKGLNNTKELKEAIMKAKTYNELINLLDEYAKNN